MPLGQGYTVEAQVTGEEKFGGVQIMVCSANPNSYKIPKRPVAPPRRSSFQETCCEEQAPMDCFGGAPSAAPMFLMKSASLAPKKSTEMGIASGGTMKQKIYSDPYGYYEWDQSKVGRCFVHLVNSEMFTEITGLPAPNTPINAKLYTSYNYPWFDIYDEHKSHVSQSSILSQIKTTHQIDQQKSIWIRIIDYPQPEQTIPIHNVITYSQPNQFRDGDWSVPSVAPSSTVQVGETQVVLTKEQEEKYKKIISMGFDAKKTLKLLIMNDWNMEKVLDLLL